MKIVISVNWNNIVDLPPTLSSSNCIETAAGKVYDGVTYTRQQLLNNFFSKIGCYFSDDRYYKLGGTRPVVYIKNKTGEIYAQESKAMYDGIRKAVKPDALPILLHGRLRRRRSQPQYVRPVRDEPFLYVPADDRPELEVQP